jgi:hypothetical protein
VDANQRRNDKEQTMTEQSKTERGIRAWARRLATGDDLTVERIIWDQRESDPPTFGQFADATIAKIKVHLDNLPARWENLDPMIGRTDSQWGRTRRPSKIARLMRRGGRA